MEWIVGFFIFLFLGLCAIGAIAAFIETNPILSLAIGGFVIFGVWITKYDKRQKENAKRDHEHQERLRYQQTALINLGEDALGLFEAMPSHLTSAESHLIQAVTDFSDRAFGPFWDHIEQAARSLARFDESTRSIDGNASQYTKLIQSFEGTPPEFPLQLESVRNLITGRVTAERMSSIVRKAQRDFQFATIYEQRKTNQILVAGFQNLAQALDGMTQEIVSSVNNLTTSVNTMTGTLNDTLSNIHSRLGEFAETSTEEKDEVAKRAQRQTRALEMLDNIQRHREPLPWTTPI